MEFTETFVIIWESGTGAAAVGSVYKTTSHSSRLLLSHVSVNPWKRGNRFVLFCFFVWLTQSVCFISFGLYTEDHCDFAKTETQEQMDLKLLAKHSEWQDPRFGTSDK